MHISHQRRDLLFQHLETFFKSVHRLVVIRVQVVVRVVLAAVVVRVVIYIAGFSSLRFGVAGLSIEGALLGNEALDLFLRVVDPAAKLGSL